jgi:hypothetical protein
MEVSTPAKSEFARRHIFTPAISAASSVLARRLSMG